MKFEQKLPSLHTTPVFSFLLVLQYIPWLPLKDYARAFRWCRDLGAMETSLNGGDLTIPLIESHLDIDEEGSSPSDRRLQVVGSGAGSPSTTSSTSKHSLGFGALVFLIYYNVGVPFGDEEVRPPCGEFQSSEAG